MADLPLAHHNSEREPEAEFGRTMSALRSSASSSRGSLLRSSRGSPRRTGLRTTRVSFEVDSQHISEQSCAAGMGTRRSSLADVVRRRSSLLQSLWQECWPEHWDIIPNSDTYILGSDWRERPFPCESNQTEGGPSRKASSSSRRSKNTSLALAPDNLRNTWISHKQSPHFFSNINVSEDGGFPKVRHLLDGGLKRILRYMKAIWVLGFLIHNLYATMYLNYGFYRESGTRSFWYKHADIRHKRFLFVQWAFIAPMNLEDTITSPDRFLTMLETLMMAVFMLSMVWKLSRGFVGFRRGDDAMVWHSISQCGFHDLRHLSAFSGMRLLHYALPKVFTSHTKRRWSAVRQEQVGYFGLIRFLLVRLCALVIGLDACMLKFIQVQYVMETSMNRTWAYVSSINFLRQVLGIVQVDLYSKDRLLFFIFAGGDTIMDRQEEAVMKTWESQLAQIIWQVYPWHQAATLMITFSDDDVQKLVLNDDPLPRRFTRSYST